MNTTIRTLTMLALLAATSAAPAGVNISISSRIHQLTDTIFEGLGIDFDLELPPIEIETSERAASAVNGALDRAQSAVNGVFGDGGPLDDFQVDLPDVDQILNGLDLPAVSVPQVAELNVQEIVDDALGQANDVLDNLDLPNVDIPQVSIPSVNVPNVQQIVDDALGRANDILDDLDLPSVDLPNIDVPAVDIPDVDQIVEDALNDAQDAVDDALGEAQEAIDGALDDAQDLLDDLDDLVPNVEEIVEDALGEAEDAVEDALDDVQDLLDDLDGIVPDVDGIVEDALGEASGVVEDVLSDIQVDLPPVAIEALESLPIELPISLGSTFLSSGPLFSASAVAVPEPSAALLACLAMGLARRRKR
ncbi:hypothetical protein MalM25_36010 [Planctomycetes bacterium MalM25]|nr:hypothetical protein MalM25_36010 [Planctomycetes bacterium MalM25]